jgi:5,10-methylenetetrahydromethanopterin reductase
VTVPDWAKPPPGICPGGAGVEFWTPLSARPALIAERARQHEEAGWDGVFVSDSQCLLPDAFVALTLAASATKRLRLAPFAANPVTRHVSVTAAAIAALHAASGYRAVLGVGRGDSALAHLGRPPVPAAEFERFVIEVRALLSGAAVAIEAVPEGRAPAALPLAAAPAQTSLHWLDPAAPRVAVAVVASGPRVISIGGSHADQVLLAVGADPRRIAWGIATAREAAAAAGRDPDALRLGALLTVVPLDDIGAATRLAAANVASVARFAVMHGQRPAGPLSQTALTVYRRLADNYDMTRHAQPRSLQAAVLTDEFIREFAIVGPADRCVERLADIAASGITRFVLVPPAVEELSRAQDRAEACLFEEVRSGLAGLLPRARQRLDE